MYVAPSKIINDDGRVITNVIEIANSFNNFFANIGSTLTNNVSPTTSTPKSFLGPSSSSSMYLSPCTSAEIEEIIDMSANKAVGPYSIPTFILKTFKHNLSKPLETIFNVSISTGCVPDDLKITKVIPIFKKGLRNCLSNYRPIILSLLSNINKILEKLVYKRTVDFLDKHKVFTNHQFGFRAQHSTIHALLLIVDKIQKAIEKGHHGILLRKLNHYGIRGISHSWFSSYLSNRKQYTTLYVTSDYVNVSYGALKAPSWALYYSYYTSMIYLHAQQY